MKGSGRNVSTMYVLTRELHEVIDPLLRRSFTREIATLELWLMEHCVLV